MTLTEFLLARITEDEAAAKAATGSTWTSLDCGQTHYDGSRTDAWEIGTDESRGTGDFVYSARAVAVDTDRDYGSPMGGCEQEADALHIARHDPARVLAECEAKRCITALHSDRYGWGDCASCADGWRDLTGGENGYEPEAYPCLTLRNLALPYAGHPDYREEWRP